MLIIGTNFVLISICSVPRFIMLTVILKIVVKKKKKIFNVQRTIVQKGKKKDKIDFCYC